VASDRELDSIPGPGGAIEAFEQAREAGKVRYIGISSHGIPMGLIGALEEYPFDAVMTGLNFYEHFNYQQTEEIFISLARDELDALFRSNPLLDNYVCRRCGACLPCPRGIDIPGVLLCPDREIVFSSETHFLR